MKNEGYNLIVNTDEPNLTRGTTHFNNEDIYVPIISFNVWEDTACSIFIDNRNGNIVIDGNTIEIDALRFKKDNIKEYIEKRFNEMIKSVLEKYKKFNKENRLDSIINDRKIKRVEW